jgi:hypothetical protein
MLPIVVVGLAALYFILYYSGALDRFSQSVNRLGRRASSGPTEKRRLLDDEVERRLKVFEDFLSQDADDEGQQASGSKDEAGSGEY